MHDFSVKISQHDKYQAELKFVFPVQSGRKAGDYHFELYFFMPNNLKINSRTFTADQFYNDFYEYIRLQTPQKNFSELANQETALFDRLKNSASDNSKSYSNLLKMYCSIVKSAMRDGENSVESLPVDKRIDAGMRYLDDTVRLLQKFRDCRPAASLKENTESFDLADEFLSISANNFRYKLWNAVKSLPDGENINSMIAKATGEELKYRKQLGYRGIPDKNSDNSELTYRKSTMKKTMAEILYLNVETRKDGVILEHILLGTAAAIAMAFVTAISFIWQGLFMEELSMSFFLVWVIAYMFKDRIKSSLQLFLLKHRSSYSYDFRQKIRDGFGNEIGICHEGFRYCDPDELDKEIVRIRDRQPLSRLNSGSMNENVMVFRKKIEIFSKPCRDIFTEFDVNGIVDIIRLNIRHWTYKMDNPKETIYLSDGKNISEIKASRNYHVNMILSYGESGKPVKLERYRIVICRNGIRRIEAVRKEGCGSL